MQPKFLIKRELQNKLHLGDGQPSAELHFHSQIELCLVYEGEVEIRVNGKRRILTAGEASVALSYDAHSYRPLRHARAYTIIIPTSMCEEFIKITKSKRLSEHFITDKAVFDKLSECFSEIHTCGENDIKALGYIYVMLGTLLDNMQFKDISEPINTELSSAVLFYLNDNFRNDIGLESVSAALGYNPSYLSRYFKTCFGIGLNRYLSVIRLSEAIRLMHEGKHSVTFCALESGFNSMRTFYRVFFSEFGCTPREYIKNEKSYC